MAARGGVRRSGAEILRPHKGARFPRGVRWMGAETEVFILRMTGSLRAMKVLKGATGAGRGI